MEKKSRKNLAKKFRENFFSAKTNLWVRNSEKNFWKGNFGKKNFEKKSLEKKFSKQIFLEKEF